MPSIWSVRRSSSSAETTPAASGSSPSRGGWIAAGAPRDGHPAVEFSWDGSDEGDHASGRGWAALDDDGSLVGHIWFHMGDDSGYRAIRVDDGRRRGRAAR